MWEVNTKWVCQRRYFKDLHCVHQYAKVKGVHKQSLLLNYRSLLHNCRLDHGIMNYDLLPFTFTVSVYPDPQLVERTRYSCYQSIDSQCGSKHPEEIDQPVLLRSPRTFHQLTALQTVLWARFLRWTHSNLSSAIQTTIRTFRNHLWLLQIWLTERKSAWPSYGCTFWKLNRK